MMEIKEYIDKYNDELAEFMSQLSTRVLVYADRHDINKDEMIAYTAYMFTAMSKFTTCENYEVEEDDEY